MGSKVKLLFLFVFCTAVLVAQNPFTKTYKSLGEVGGISHGLGSIAVTKNLGMRYIKL